MDRKRQHTHTMRIAREASKNDVLDRLRHAVVCRRWKNAHPLDLAVASRAY